MRTRTRVAFLSAAAVLVAVTAVSAQIQNEIALTRAEIQTERQAIVAENLPLTEEQAKAFWPLYRSYRGELASLGDRAVTMIEGYANKYETMSDADAQAMIDEYFAIQKDELKVKTSWLPKFAKVLPATKIARFVQIENRLDAIIRIELATEIPLVEHRAKQQTP